MSWPGDKRRRCVDSSEEWARLRTTIWSCQCKQRPSRLLLNSKAVSCIKAISVVCSRQKLLTVWGLANKHFGVKSRVIWEAVCESRKMCSQESSISASSFLTVFPMDTLIYKVFHQPTHSNAYKRLHQRYLHVLFHVIPQRFDGIALKIIFE